MDDIFAVTDESTGGDPTRQITRLQRSNLHAGRSPLQ